MSAVLHCQGGLGLANGAGVDRPSAMRPHVAPPLRLGASQCDPE